MGVEGAGGRELVRSLAGLEDATGTLTAPAGSSTSPVTAPAACSPI